MNHVEVQTGDGGFQRLVLRYRKELLRCMFTTTQKAGPRTPLRFFGKELCERLVSSGVLLEIRKFPSVKRYVLTRQTRNLLAEMLLGEDYPFKRVIDSG